MNLYTALFKALFCYHLAEFQGGYASRINVFVKNDQFTIADNGRGHSMNRTVDGIPYLKMVYNHLRIPFDGRIPSVQLHTIGISLINELSKSLEIRIKRKIGTQVHQFEYGTPVKSFQEENPSGETGNRITCRFEIKEDMKPSTSEVLCYLEQIKQAYPELKIFLNSTPLDHSSSK